MNDEDLLQMLGELRDETVPFASVRRRVLAMSARQRQRPRVVGWPWWTAAAAALLVLTLASRPAWKVESLTLPAPPALVVETPSFEVVSRPPLVRPAKIVKPPSEAFTVKMLTDDPDVVVYWIVGGEGEE